MAARHPADRGEHALDLVDGEIVPKRASNTTGLRAGRRRRITQPPKGRKVVGGGLVVALLLEQAPSHDRQGDGELRLVDLIERPRPDPDAATCTVCFEPLRAGTTCSSLAHPN